MSLAFASNGGLRHRVDRGGHVANDDLMHSTSRILRKTAQNRSQSTQNRNRKIIFCWHELGGLWGWDVRTPLFHTGGAQ